MIKITGTTTLKELALIVGKILKDANIDAVLTGGAVVSIYTDHKYLSFDLDFITYSTYKELKKAFKGTGFYQDGRYFKHPETDFYVDFPAPPLSIGNKPIEIFHEIVMEDKYLKLLTPTHSAMDRLAAYYYWDDQQSFLQALMIAKKNTIDFEEIRTWSQEEGMIGKYNNFYKEYKKVKTR